MSVELMRVPMEAFNDVVKEREFIRVMLLNSKDKATLRDQMAGYDGVSDIHILSGPRKDTLIQRNDLIKNYRNLDGSKIRMIGWHYHKVYTVYTDVQEQYKMLKVPRRGNRLITINGQPLPKSSIVLCRVDLANQTVDLNTPIILSEAQDIKEFRKMYRVVNLGSLRNARSAASERECIQQIMVDRERANNTKISSPIQKPVEDELTRARYEAIGRAVNTQGKLIGFLIRDTKTGAQNVLNLTAVKDLCVQKQIRNLTVGMRQETGKYFFRGVGIRVENLPSQIYG